jgi:hypothetical protein
MGILSDLKPLTGSLDYTSPNEAIESLVKDNPSVSRFLKRDPFWEDTETVLQFHVPRNQHINTHENTLHLWRQVGVEVARPPQICV